MLIFLNALDSKRKSNQTEIGTVKAPINIIPGILFSFPRTLVNTHNTPKVIAKAINTLENTHGLLHSSETSLI